MARLRSALFVAALLASCALAIAAADGDWKNGRVTWFDVQNDDLTTANCHLSWASINTGRDVAAFSDTNPLFSSSCGMCLEIRCQNAAFSDGYGNSIDRSAACSDTSKSVFLTVADACPCKYPNNESSNKRWCCGDDPSREHIDVTRGAFSQLANLNLGVIGVQWRVVDCSQVKQGGSYYPSTPSSSSSPSSSPSSSSGGGGGSPSRGWFGGNGGGGGGGGLLGRIFGRR